METSTIILILAFIHVAVSSYMVGVATEQRDNWGVIILAAVFGFELALFAAIAGLAVKFWVWVNGLTQINFWFLYTFGGYKNLPQENLYNLNFYNKDRKDSLKFKDRLLTHCIDLINKRNSYTYVLKKEEIETEY